LTILIRESRENMLARNIKNNFNENSLDIKSLDKTRNSRQDEILIKSQDKTKIVKIINLRKKILKYMYFYKLDGKKITIYIIYEFKKFYSINKNIYINKFRNN